MGKSTISMVIFYVANCEFHYQRVRSLNHPHEFTGEAAIPGRRMTAIDPALKFKLHEHADGVDNNQQAHHQFLHRLPVELSFCGSFFYCGYTENPDCGTVGHHILQQVSKDDIKWKGTIWLFDIAMENHL